MTVTGPQTTVEPPEPGARRIGGKPRRRNATLLKVLIGVGVLVVLLSVTAAITGAHDLTSPGTIGAALALSMPIAMAGLGGLWSERAGVVNIGLEGMMILGTWGAGWAGYQWGPWTGVLVGAAMGAAGGLLFRPCFLRCWLLRPRTRRRPRGKAAQAIGTLRRIGRTRCQAPRVMLTSTAWRESTRSYR
jgi:hypothetical protein